ncbi:hypothetical protein DSLASN_20280 [Desulfoluna limicola]|uniref:AB hydrolase-1 domain-containing protein n=1 Tax=Desulfoluna limicola TaxID=2810562 RepID=A0ABN6F4I0_9BACT|nr:hypothetical protein DSLASN_20280 [Desulfoluna limicola]
MASKWKQKASTRWAAVFIFLFFATSLGCVTQNTASVKKELKQSTTPSAGIVPEQLSAPSAGKESTPPITPSAEVASLADLKQYYSIENFKLGGTYNLDDPASYEYGGEGGVTLESLGQKPLHLGYITLGNPQKDQDGKITNAVIVNSYYSGDSTSIYDKWVEGQAGNDFCLGAVIGPGKLIDTEKNFVVLLDAIGLWGGSKPSDGLGMKFPKYSYFDMVQASYRLLKDELGVGTVKLATGVSMGATQTYVWGVLHPEFVENLMPIGGTTQSDGGDPLGNWIFQLMTEAIKSDPVWMETNGDYYHLPKDQHPNQGVMFGWSVLNHTALSFDLRVTQPWDEIKKDVFYWNPEGEAAANLKKKADVQDACDLIYRNAAGLTYNINDDLHRIRAKTLVLHVGNDNWLNVNLAWAAADKIPGAETIIFDSPIAHYAVFQATNLLKDNAMAKTFFMEAGLIDKPGATFTARNYRKPRVVMQGDPQKSFWKNQVLYPFPVKYATGTDSRGVKWEIGYMDEYDGDKRNPESLVIIHGKGAFAGHYGYVMKYALERGLRVIALDMPGYGMSGPGNLDKSSARTLQDCRDAIHDVVVEQLKVKRAYYMGHSLGGQFCLGYALSYPDTVKGLVLEAPAGLEEFPVEIGGAPAFDPSYAHDFDRWREVWDPFGALQNEKNLTEEGIRLFNDFKKKDPDTGEIVSSKFGYFKQRTEYARLLEDQRVAIIEGNGAEFEQGANAFIYDVYSIGSELVKGDKNSLYSRLTEIKVPIFLMFGNEEPFIPSTGLNGLDSLSDDVIIPFMERMTAAGNRPLLKVYPGAAHFIHTDVPYEFAKDTADFVLTGQVDVLTSETIKYLFNPPAVAQAAANSQPAPAGNKKSAFSK